ncbi:glycosyltransferase [Ensifer soli]|uniref:glycosyltransferase n=1 Tax=Ciceribacter sp. sgz301302 TaxID=3342379 RepID=UPI0035B8D5FE
MSDHLKIYVGYDSREDIAWQVCRHSILRYSGPAVEVYPLKQAALRELGLYTRGADMAATEFSLTRFLVPYLGAHDGWTIFVDCDFLFTRDVHDVLQHASRDKAIFVVQHDYTPANMVKMDGKPQAVYPRKNWSSFILFNNAHPEVRALTPSVVNTAAPGFLHRFQWLSADSLIGALPLEWNFLEGEYPRRDGTPAAIHYTNGGPWFENWQNVDYADLWITERALYETAMHS